MDYEDEIAKGLEKLYKKKGKLISHQALMRFLVPKKMAPNVFTKYAHLATAHNKIKSKAVGTTFFYKPVEAKEKLRKRAGAKRITPYQRRVNHARALKREVIRLWLKQLPKDIPYIKGAGKLLPVESVPLFEDFRFHVCHEPDPFELLESYKEKVGEYWKTRAELSNRIEDDLEKLGFGRSWSDVVLGFALNWERALGTHEMLGLPSMPPTVEFGALRSVDGRPARIAVGRAEPGETYRRNEILRSSVKGGKYSAEARAILSVARELESLKNEMKKVLEDHLRHPGPFPGECKLLK